jgi:hypothetical protein
MEYPFLKCPEKSTDTEKTKSFTRVNSDNPPQKEAYAPETVAKLIKQAIILEEESMKLLDLLVELIEQKPKAVDESDESPSPVYFELKNRLY